jgi:hypothetical protein
MTKSKEKGKRMKPNPFQFVLLIVYAWFLLKPQKEANRMHSLDEKVE